MHLPIAYKQTITFLLLQVLLTQHFPLLKGFLDTSFHTQIISRKLNSGQPFFFCVKLRMASLKKIRAWNEMTIPPKY